MIMRSLPRRLSSAKTNLLSHNNFSLSDELRIKPDILTPYILYKKIPFPQKLKLNNNIINPFLNLKNLRKNNSSNLLLSIKNIIKKNKNEKNNKSPITNINTKPKIENQENKFKKRYTHLIRNLSFNGNSKVTFRNLSNEILDKIFKSKPFSSFVKPKSPPNIIQKKTIRYKYENLLNKINNNKENVKSNYYYLNEKEINNINSLSNKNIFNKKFQFENKILRNESKDIYFEKYKNIPITSARAKNRRKNNLFDNVSDNSKKKNIRTRSRTRKSASISFSSKFQNLKMKLRKQNDVNSKLINNIKKEQSLSKYKLQVGIVKLNKYISKNKKIKKNNKIK